MSDRETPEAIETRIHKTQDELRKDLEALEEKLSPEALKAEARDRVEEAKELVKEKAVESTRQVGEAVRGRIGDVADQMRDRQTGGPFLSLLGLAVVIGIGLLLIGDGRDETRKDARYVRSPRPPEPAPRDMPPPATTHRPYVP